jgi:5'-nucleotidase
MAGDRKDVRLLVVGARYERDYEIEYCKQVEEAIGNDKRIELHPCTMDVEPFYAQSDVLIMTSTNEVTPLTIYEAMIRGIPVITSDIAGIPDMLDDTVEGFVISLEKEDLWVKRMKEMAGNPDLLASQGLAAAKRAKERYSMKAMIEAYRKTSFLLSPPIILVDMDGVLVDWDKGFYKVWGDRPMGSRTKYEMELCVGEGYAEEAKAIFNEKDFFLNLPPMPGAIEAINAIAARGYVVKICTRPVLSPFCAQEKYEWVRKHLGPEWVPKIIMTCDKTLVSGALLIDDHPNVKGERFPSWRQVLFDAPYNKENTDLPRLTSWSHWERVFDEELLFAPKSNVIKKEELSKLSVGKSHFNVIRNLSWPMLGGIKTSPATTQSPPSSGSPQLVSATPPADSPATDSDSTSQENDRNINADLEDLMIDEETEESVLT